jgi:hypothetical protein
MLRWFVKLPIVPMAMELPTVQMMPWRCHKEVDYQLAVLMWMRQIPLLALSSLL